MGDSWTNLARQDGATTIFGQMDGTTIPDRSGNGNDATIQSGGVHDRSLVNSATINSLKCSFGHATAADATEFDVTDPWSIEIVIRRSVGVPLGNPHIIVAGTNSADNQFRIMQSGSNIWAGIKIGGSELAIDGPTISTSEVVHLIYVYVSASATVYRNGIVQSTGTPSLPVIANAASLFIGDSPAGSESFATNIGPIAIYKSIQLTASQSATHANAALGYDNRGSHTGSGRFSNRGLASGSL